MCIPVCPTIDRSRINPLPGELSMFKKCLAAGIVVLAFSFNSVTASAGNCTPVRTFLRNVQEAQPVRTMVRKLAERKPVRTLIKRTLSCKK